MENQSGTKKEIKIEYAKIDAPSTQQLPEMRDIFGTFQTVDSTATGILVGVPRKFSEQIVFYKNGATLRLYMFNITEGAWHYITMTA